MDIHVIDMKKLLGECKFVYSTLFATNQDIAGIGRENFKV